MMARHKPERLEYGNHRRASSEATATTTSPPATATHHPLRFLAPAAAASKDPSFDFKRLFGDWHSLDRERARDRDAGFGIGGLSASNPASRARTPPPPTPPPSGALLQLQGGDMASPPPAAKIHASPSKGSSSSSALTASGRTYDAKLMQREMLRLGTLAHHLPSAATSTLSSQSSAMSLSSTATLVAGSGNIATSGGSTAGIALGHGLGVPATLGGGVGGNDGWAQLHVHVLPLFNHERLQSPIEDLNILVRRHIETVMSRAPSRALATLENDVAELINSGMITLNTKLVGVEDDKLVGRVVEIWCFFWDQVLPYVEGVFLPLQTDALLINLHRTPRPHRPGSPTMQESSFTNTSSNASSPIDVRTIALRAFRDKIILPIAPRLEALLLSLIRRNSVSGSTATNGSSLATETAAYHQPRLQQMLLVLHAQGRRSQSSSSLSGPLYTLNAQETVVRTLLDLLAAQAQRGTHSTYSLGGPVGSRYNSPARGVDSRRPPSFLSGGPPRDRRGRVAGKANAPVSDAAAWRRARVLDGGGDEDELDYGQVLSGGLGGSGAFNAFGSFGGSGAGAGGGGAATPRTRFSAERERDRSFLESLRSPNPIDYDDDEGGGGGGSGIPTSGAGEKYAAENGLDWDSAQAVVERMVGMNGAADALASPSTPSPSQAEGNGDLFATPTATAPPPNYRLRRRMT